MDQFIAQILRKRHLVIVLSLALIAAGVVAYQRLLFEGYPDVANMQVVVISQAPGKAAEEVEKFITVPIEKELNGIPHAEQPYSKSIFGLSVITLVFDDQIDPNQARQQVLERLQHVVLPDGVKPELGPNASALGEVFRYTVEGSHWSPMARKELQDWLLNRKFKSIPGIIDSTTFGGPTKTYQVQLDPARMQALNITQDQVAQALAHSNDSTGGSYIVLNEQSYMVRGIGLLQSIEDIQDSVVSASKDGPPVRVKDIATVTIAPAIRRGQFGKNDDDDAVEGIVLMRRGENPSVAVDNIRAKWGSIMRALPAGMQIVPLYDRTALVKRTVNTISHNVALGIVLVVTLLILFLFQVRSALICSTVIPLALLSAFILLNVFRVPANLLSLGAIDFGIIVDGAVVMVENIVRRLVEFHESGERTTDDFFKAVVRGASEIAKPVLFSTAIILLTFLPILSFEHVEGRLFRPLAIMMNFNLLGGVLATMTVIPVLCFLVFQRKLPTERVSPILKVLEGAYERILAAAMRFKFAAIALAAAFVVGALALAPLLGSEFLPELEEGNIWLRITVLPTSVAPEKSVKIAHEVRRVIGSYPEVTNVVSQIGSSDDGTDPNTFNNIELLVDLKPQEEWRSQFHDKQELIASIEHDLKARMPNLLYSFSQYIKDNMDEAIAGVKGGEFVVNLYGPDLNELTSIARKIEHIVQDVPGMVDIASDKLIGQPQLKVSIDRKAAARYGITADDILDVVQTSIGGRTITQLLEGDRRFDIVLRFKQDFRQDPNSVKNILVTTPLGVRIPLSQVASVTEDHGANQILRDKNQRRITVKANIRGRDLGSAVMDAQRRIDSAVQLPTDYIIDYAGQFDREQEALARLAVVVPATLVLIFLLLYLQFGNASLAALTMVTVPLAASGGLLSLFLTKTHFSISAGLGFIALFGVAIQNGVILVSKIRDLREEGHTIRNSAFNGARIRMRPVFIAAVVAMAGLVPAAISTGIGSQSQRPFAIVIVGGILPATILSLLVLPILYQWFDRSRGKAVEHKDEKHEATL